MNTKTKAISEGAMMLALIGVVLIADRQFAGFFELFLYFLSIPMVIYEVRHGAKMGMTLAISSIIIAFLFSTITGMFYTVTAILIGWIYGYGIIKDWKNGQLLLSCVIGNVLTTYITVVLFAGVFGYDLNAEVLMMMEMVPDVSLPGLDMAKIILEIVVLSYLAIAFMQALVTHLLSNLFLQRFKLKYRKLNSIYDVKVSKWLGVLILSAFILYQWSATVVLEEWMHQSIMAFYLVAMLIAMVLGCITMMCYLRIKGKGRWAIFACMFACMIPVLNMVIATIGVLDIFMDIRLKMKEGVLREASRKN